MSDKTKSSNPKTPPTKPQIPPRPNRYHENNNRSGSVIHNGKIVSKDRPISKPPTPEPSK